MTDLTFTDLELSPHEESRFKALENTVQDGLRDFQRTGKALAEIRDNEFYRSTHASFEDYLSDKWGFSLKQADRIIDASEAANKLESLGIEASSEGKARKFKPAVKILEQLEPEQKRLISRLVEERRSAEAEETPPWEDSAAPELKIMASVVQKMSADTSVFHPESGETVAFNSLSPSQRYTVVQEHVNQKTQAYHEKQAAKAAQEPEEKINWAAWCLDYAKQGLETDQRLEIVLEQGDKGKPIIFARVIDKSTGAVVIEGQASGQIRKAVLGLVSEISS